MYLNQNVKSKTQKEVCKLYINILRLIIVILIFSNYHNFLELFYSLLKLSNIKTINFIKLVINM
jgi:hypothetical protein